MKIAGHRTAFIVVHIGRHRGQTLPHSEPDLRSACTPAPARTPTRSPLVSTMMG
jgi:hypothetical protein